jgi:hypothetical protein
MGTTRTEQAIDEIDGDDFDPSCDDIRLAWLAHELSDGSAGQRDFDALWLDR